MKFNRTNCLITFALSLFLLLPFGCGGDDNPPESAYDSQGVDVTPGPTFLITSGGGEDFTTNQATLTLEGLTDMTATAVMVGELTATLTDSDLDDTQAWSIDLDLNEGENAFTVNAQDSEGHQGLEKAVTITYDPDYVSDPPENSIVAYFYVYWTSTKCYDPAGSRPSEIRATITLGGTISDSYSRNAAIDTYADNHTHLLQQLSTNYVDDKTYTIYLHVWEEDDGFFTGGDDPVGDGNVSFTSAEVDTGMQKTISIDGNWVDVRAFLIHY